MQAGLPVLACTDPNTDIGKVITDGGFGWRCESGDEIGFAEVVETIGRICMKQYGDQAVEYVKCHYVSEVAYKIVMKELCFKTRV